MIACKKPGAARLKFSEIYAHELNGNPPPSKRFFKRNLAKFKQHGSVRNLVCMLPFNDIVHSGGHRILILSCLLFDLFEK